MSHPEIELARNNALAACNKAMEALGLYVDSYVADYQLDSDEGGHNPSDLERVLIADAIGGLLADDDFNRLHDALRQQQRFLASLPPT